MFVCRALPMLTQSTRFRRSRCEVGVCCSGKARGGKGALPQQLTCCDSCNERSAKARDLIDQKELFYEKDFSLLGDLADTQAVKRTKQSLVGSDRWSDFFHRLITLQTL